MKLLIIALSIASSTMAQKKVPTDSAKHIDSAAILQAQVGAINYVLEDIKLTLYSKVNSQSYELFLKMIDVYVGEKKKQFEPKKK